MKELQIRLARNRLDCFSGEETSEIGLHEEIEVVKKLLIGVHRLLESTTNQSNQIDELITRIEEVVSYIEDAVDSNRHRAKFGREYSAKRCFGLSSCLRRLHDPHTSIKSEIKELHDQMKYALNSTNIDFHRAERVNERLERHEWQRLDPLAHKTDTCPVGLSDVKAQIIQHLLVKGDNLKVISLCGMGGVGKTTLAEGVFKDERVQYGFRTKIWIRLSSKVETKDVLLHILSQFISESDPIKDPELAHRVRDCLRESERYLVVLDDVWPTQVSDDLYSFFPDNQKGSRILLTTRNRRLAEYGSNPKPFAVYTVHPLGQEDAWELFMKTIQGHHGSAYELDAYKKEIGKEMVKFCEGLPVAIIALGQELAARKSSDEWHIVYRNSISFLKERILAVLAPSFDDLSDFLKPCFLYLGIWPEDSMIDVEKLYHFWMVEGFVKPEHIAAGETLLNAAEFYLNELVMATSMVDVKEEESPIVRTLNSFRIHRMMRQLCISKFNQIDFSHTIDFRLSSSFTSSSSRNKPRRLFVCLERPEDLSSILDNKELTEHLHILQFIDSYKQQNREPIRLSGKFEYKELGLLRLLDFNGVDFRQDLPDEGMSNVSRISGLLEGIANLVNLRYLSFKGCFLDQLPLSISNLVHLQILDLRVDNSITEVTLPNVLWKMRKMKHLYLPGMFRTYNGEKLRLDGLMELETLENFITVVCNVTDLHTCSKLHNLAVRIDGSLSDLQTINKHMKQNIEIQLSMDVRNFDCYTEDRHYVVREVLESQTLRMFCIEGHICELPAQYKISPTLIKIALSGSELVKDPMETLSKLPNLRVLVLDDDAFVGRIMVSPASGFRELKHLELLSLQYLEEWVVENNCMPKLCNTKIENCKNLAKIPDRFRVSHCS